MELAVSLLFSTEILPLIEYSHESERYYHKCEQAPIQGSNLMAQRLSSSVLSQVRTTVM
jgi:hypothetical protein